MNNASSPLTNDSAGPIPRQSADLVAVVAAMLFPSLATWLYFVAFAGHESMQAVYSTVKVLQFTFPLIWVALIRGRWPRFAWREGAGVGQGLAFGAIIGLSMLIGYRVITAQAGWLDAGIAEVQAKVSEMGLATPGRFVLLALFYSLIHSLLEEYYWRWFVFGELRRFAGNRVAIGLSSLGFMAHHVIVLGLYFREAWWLTLLGSLAVAVGGAFWAWLYRRSGTLWGPWFSHALIDAAIMAVGYQMLWG